MGLFTRNIPSDAGNIIRILKGSRVLRMLRKLNWNPGDYEDSFNIKKSDLFNLGYGPLYIEVESGIVIGVANISKWNSIVLWLENDSIDTIKTLSPNNKDVLYMDCCDENYCASGCREFIGKKITKLTLLKSKRKIHSQYKNEVGLILENEKGGGIVLSQKIYKGLGHFVVTDFDDKNLNIDESLDMLNL